MDASLALAAAYLRCNGSFVLTELPVQVESYGEFRPAADIDPLAVRLPCRSRSTSSPSSGRSR